MLSDPGLTGMDAVRSAVSEAQASLMRTNLGAKNLHGDLLNSEDALAYIQEFIRKFKKDQVLTN
jgi:hypothetical protein